MNLCVMDEYYCRTVNHQQLQKGNKWALKLIGVINSDVSSDDFLEFISLYVNPNSIQAFFYDYFNSFYTLFLSDVESFCLLVGKKESMGSYSIRFLPLLDFYVVNNVYPCVTNDDLCRTFETFGSVFQVSNYHVLPNSPKFSHVLSGKREISFTLPGEKSELDIPINVFQSPYRYHVRKLCSACLTEGHSVLHCPDIEEDFKSECDEEDSSNSELSCILKTEIISGLHSHSNDSCEEIKEEVTSPDLNCAPQSKNDNSLVPALSLEENAAVPFNNTDDSEKSYDTHFAENTQEAVKSNETSNFLAGYSHKNKFKENLNIPDIIDLETDDSVDGFEISSPENTQKAVATNFASTFFRSVVHRRQIRETLYTHDTVMNNETEDSIESDEGLNRKRRRLNTRRKSQSADISTMERNGCDNNLSQAASETKKPRQVLWNLSPKALELIDNSVGVLPSQALKDIILCDGRKRSVISNLILEHTSDINAVDEQLKRLYKEFKLSKLSSSIRYQHIQSKIVQIRQIVWTL